MAGLGEALPPTARSGLMLFLRRGMWGWAQTLAAASHVPQSVASLTPPVPRNERTAVIYVLATMAMSEPENAMKESLKVQPHHLERGAYLYIRQSSMRQVIENVESAKRQYALRGRAIALGWRDEQIIVVDNDQGEFGASAAWREGFQRLVSDVGMGRAGIVMGLEVSRLARNNADWQRLLEICALADTLILDEDGVTIRRASMTGSCSASMAASVAVGDIVVDFRDCEPRWLRGDLAEPRVLGVMVVVGQYPDQAGRRHLAHTDWARGASSWRWHVASGTQSDARRGIAPRSWVRRAGLGRADSRSGRGDAAVQAGSSRTTAR